MSIIGISGCTLKNGKIEKIVCDSYSMYPCFVYSISSVDIIKSNNEVYKEKVAIGAAYYVAIDDIENTYFEVDLPDNLLPAGVERSSGSVPSYGHYAYYIKDAGIYVYFKIQLSPKTVKEYPIRLKYVDGVAIVKYWTCSKKFINELTVIEEKK